MELDEQLTSFARRLIELCDDMKLPARGRQVALGRRFGVSQAAARKWLVGGLPDLSKAVEIARWANVNLEWLMTGRGPKRGNLVDSKALVLGEAIENLPIDNRQQVLSFLEYQLQRSSTELFTREKLARYMTMIDAFKKDRDTKGS